MKLPKTETDKLQKYIEEKNIKSILEMADFYLEGKKYELYLEILNESWSFAEAQYRLGHIHLDSNLDFFDEEKGVQCFYLALKMGLLDAAYSLFQYLAWKGSQAPLEGVFKERYEESIDFILQKKDPKYIDALARNFHGRGNEKKALEILLSLPEDVNCVVQAANLCLFTENPDMYDPDRGFKLAFDFAESFTSKGEDVPSEVANVLAWAYFHGRGTDQNLPKAQEYAEAMLATSPGISHGILSRIFYKTENYDKAAESLRFLVENKLADDGDYRYIIHIYDYFSDKIEDKKNNALTWYQLWFKNLPNKNSAEQMARVLMYHTDFKNEKEAYLFLKQNVSTFPSLNNELGDCYRMGIGTEKDIQKSIDAYKVAVNYFEDGEAALGIAINYEREIEYIDSRSLAHAAYEKAIELGADRAIILYANHLYSIGEYEKSYEYLKKQADPDADLCWYTHMGELYEFGHHVDQDLKKAKEYYEKADADVHCHCGTRALAKFYFLGHDQESDKEKAFELFEKANKKVENVCGTVLGYMHAKGLGVDVDLKKAYEYFLERKENKHDPAAYYNLGVMYKKGIHVKQDEKEAESLMQKALEMAEKNLDKPLIKTIKENTDFDFVYPYEQK